MVVSKDGTAAFLLSPPGPRPQPKKRTSVSNCYNHKCNHEDMMQPSMTVDKVSFSNYHEAQGIIAEEGKQCLLRGVGEFRNDRYDIGTAPITISKCKKTITVRLILLNHLYFT